MSKTVKIILILLMCGVTGILTASENDVRGGIAIQTGVFKPTSIDNYPSEPLKLMTASKQALTMALISPSWHNNSIRLQTTRWSYFDSQNQSISFYFLSLDIKHQIVSQPKISPFVTLGGALIFARDDKSAGYQLQSLPGLNVGSGIDFHLSTTTGLALEYQYLYIVMDRTFGDTDNYSGPSIGLKFYWLF